MYSETEVLSDSSYDFDLAPCIEVGTVFQDTDECQYAVTQWAILHDHGFKRVNKDRTRFTAKCKRWEEGCPWKFYACTGKKYIGCKVKTSGPLHTCGSFNKCGDTMASNKWVADRAMDMLLDNPEMKPKQIQVDLKKLYDIEVPYDRVVRGREKALDRIQGA